MKPIRTLLLASALAAGGFLAGRHVSGAPAAPAAAGSAAVLHWTCPMHPGVRSDRPGTAPCCGMALEPVHAGGARAVPAGAPPGTVALDTGLRQLQGVKLGAVERAAARQALRLLGRVAPDERRVYSLNAAMDGTIRQVSDATVGSLVRRDEWLGTFFAADIRGPLQALLTALEVQELDAAARVATGNGIAAGSTPTRNARFAMERLRAMGLSPTQIEEMRRRREVPVTIDIRSPIDGVVLARGISPGHAFDKGHEWFRIANLDRVWVIADLAEADAALVRPGARATVTVPGRAEPLAATVSAVPPIFDAESRTLKLRLELANPGAALRPDMFVDVGLAVERPEAITVPVDAVVDAGLRRTVFVEREAGIFEPRAVETGWRAGGRVEIVRGLAPGERIVVAGTFLVDSESQLRAAAAPVAAAPAAVPAAASATAEGARDPVCGMTVDPAAARAAGRVLERAGETFFFCSDGCHHSFAAGPEPERHAAAADDAARGAHPL